MLYSNKRFFQFDGIYVDSYGMVISDFNFKQKDMNSFKLNPKTLLEIRQRLLEGK